MTTDILLLPFGGTKQILGASELVFPLEGACSVLELLEILCHRYPALAAHKRSVRLAVNGSYANGSDRVSPGDEVALIPPVAGG